MGNGDLSGRKLATNRQNGAEEPSVNGQSQVTRRMEICLWCVNNNKERCVSLCQPEGRYRFFEPEPPAHFEIGPSLPPFRELITWNAYERLAMVYLMLWMADWEKKKE